MPPAEISHLFRYTRNKVIQQGDEVAKLGSSNLSWSMAKKLKQVF